MSRQLLRTLRDESGFSLAEMLVTVALLAVVMTAVTGTVVAFQSHVGQTRVRYDDLGQARTALNPMQQSLRTAISLNPSDTADSAFFQATPDAVEFFANLAVSGGDAPKRVRYERNAAEILETIEDGVLVETSPGSGVLEWQAIAGSERQRVLARGVAPGDPVFSYFGADTSAGELPAGAGGALDATQRAQIRQVRISVRIDSGDGYGVGVTELRTQVTVPNLYYKDEGNAS